MPGFFMQKNDFNTSKWNLHAVSNKIASVNPMHLRERGTKTKALIALAMVSFFWGTTWLASRAGVKNMPALQMAGIRQTLGGLIYVIWFLAKGQPLPRGKQWVPVLILTFLNFICSNGLSTWGVKYISSGLCYLVYKKTGVII